MRNLDRIEPERCPACDAELDLVVSQPLGRSVTTDAAGRRMVVVYFAREYGPCGCLIYGNTDPFDLAGS